MFDQLSDSLSGAISRLTSRGKLTEANIEEGLREVRKALLEADVSIAVVRDFIERVKTKAIGATQIQGVDPAQQIIKVVNDELTALMGPIDTRVQESSQKRPTVIMLVGLQGSGKTTTCGKLAHFLTTKKKRKPLLVAADLQRPAAIDQLKVLGEQLDVPVYAERPTEKKGLTGMFKRTLRAPQVCKKGIEHAMETGRDIVILDTAGRLHIDDELMGELREIKQEIGPENIFFVCDAMTGQDAVNSAQRFNDELAIDGVILTKLDGDARGGAALSIKAITGKTIKFVGMGEKLDQLEEFHPDRMASRILGMGDVVSLVERAAEVVDQETAERSATRLMSGKWNFEDFLQQLHTVKKMGPLKQLMKMIPGMGSMMKHVDFSGDELKPIEAIIQSMTPMERKDPDLLSGRSRTAGGRKRRIAKGAGTTVQDVNALVRQFKQMKRMIGELTRMGDLGALMTADGVQDSMMRMPGGRALARKVAQGTGRKPKPKRNKKPKRRAKR